MKVDSGDLDLLGNAEIDLSSTGENRSGEDEEESSQGRRNYCPYIEPTFIKDTNVPSKLLYVNPRGRLSYYYAADTS